MIYNLSALGLEHWGGQYTISQKKKFFLGGRRIKCVVGGGITKKKLKILPSWIFCFFLTIGGFQSENKLTKCKKGSRYCTLIVSTRTFS